MIVPGPAAAVSGWEATVLAVVLRDYQRRGGFARLPAGQRRLVDAAIADLERAGKLWREASPVSTSVPERSKPAAVSMVAHSGWRASCELLTVTEAAEILGVSVSTVRRLMGNGRGDLPAVQIGRSVRFRMSDLETFVETRRSA
jgi:excisionase family DNA binding protein